jgi:hypothetical protein
MVTVGCCFIGLSHIFQDTTWFRISVGDALTVFYESSRSSIFFLEHVGELRIILLIEEEKYKNKNTVQR